MDRIVLGRDLMVCHFNLIIPGFLIAVLNPTDSQNQAG
jgi:hypothetical protein